MASTIGIISLSSGTMGEDDLNGHADLGSNDSKTSTQLIFYHSLKA